MQVFLFAHGCVVGFVPSEAKGHLPLWKALKIAQRRLKPEVRDRLLGVVSSRILAGQYPTAWRFVFFDAGTSGSQRVVTVAANGSSEQPETQELFNQRRLPLLFEIIDLKRVRLEGTDAMKLASTMVQVKARELELSLFQPQGNPEPRWLVRFYAGIESPPLDGVLLCAYAGTRFGWTETTIPAT
jgi:hypothetical protein